MKNRTIKQLLNFNLQLFADDPAPADNQNKETGDPKPGEDKPGEKGDPKPANDEKRFTQADVDRMIAENNARNKRSAEKAIKEAVTEAKAEAEKYAKMSEDEKRRADEMQRQKEMDDLKAENERLKSEAMHRELGAQAAQDLAKGGYPSTPDVLEFVTGKDAEETKQLTNRFKTIINADRKAQEVKRATGSTPKAFGEQKPIDPFTARINKYQRK